MLVFVHVDHCIIPVHQSHSDLKMSHYYLLNLSLVFYLGYRQDLLMLLVVAAESSVVDCLKVEYYLKGSSDCMMIMDVY